MGNRHDAESRDHVEGTPEGFRPERLEAAEFTMRASAGTDAQGTPPRESPAHEPAVEDSDGDTTNREVLDTEQIDRRRADWDDLQTRFIDDPRQAVEEADRMVSDTIDDITRSLTRQREQLQQDWTDVDNTDTEELRMTLQRYRRLLDRLLSIAR